MPTESCEKIEPTSEKTLAQHYISDSINSGMAIAIPCLGLLIAASSLTSSESKQACSPQDSKSSLLSCAGIN